MLKLTVSTRHLAPCYKAEHALRRIIRWYSSLLLIFIIIVYFQYHDNCYPCQGWEYDLRLIIGKAEQTLSNLRALLPELWSNCYQGSLKVRDNCYQGSHKVREGALHRNDCSSSSHFFNIVQIAFSYFYSYIFMQPAPKTAKFGPKYAVLVILGQILAFLAHLIPCLTKKGCE